MTFLSAVARALRCLFNWMTSPRVRMCRVYQLCVIAMLLPSFGAIQVFEFSVHSVDPSCPPQCFFNWTTTIVSEYIFRCARAIDSSPEMCEIFGTMRIVGHDRTNFCRRVFPNGTSWFGLGNTVFDLGERLRPTRWLYVGLVEVKIPGTPTEESRAWVGRLVGASDCGDAIQTEPHHFVYLEPNATFFRFPMEWIDDLDYIGFKFDSPEIQGIEWIQYDEVSVTWTLGKGSSSAGASISSKAVLVMCWMICFFV
eukprot:Gregarina_sp_Poly_1__2310@NODE_1618_length_3708_cov_145_999176_g1065_i0_p2_GENE_NODE_1618_length_3708_cov_145_999176_g1065_i0NODE_1618_length_3708_cov_145_999176_g1065_i0_p2_ORF_typecomplete_len254_score17_31_NODE_1618_length_3708_cov_145_999176_g1065_i07931554